MSIKPETPSATISGASKGISAPARTREAKVMTRRPAMRRRARAMSVHAAFCLGAPARRKA